MPYNNSNALTDKEFYAGIARLMDNKPATVRKYWEDGIYEFIVRELFFRGNIRIPHLGTITLKHLDETYSKQTDPDGNPVVYRVPERDIPVFTPHDSLINDCNMQGVTKKYRKRAKNNKLNPADVRREQRIAQFGMYGSMTEQRIEQQDNDFAELLLQRKTEKEGEANGED